MVTGPGSVVGEALADHPDVAKVSFTGSTEIGSRIMSVAARTIKKVFLELGGNRPMSSSPTPTSMSAYLPRCGRHADNAGQDCCARSRLLVEESIYPEVAERFVAAAEAIRMGDPTREETEMGPLISITHRDRVNNYLPSAALRAPNWSPAG